jgi:hypothetical protein
VSRPSPLQNRVTPWGDVIADPSRGMFLGNRGCLSDEPFRLATRRWRLRAWIICVLKYKDWWRPVMRPGVWTELFFLDEATALAAGHRPCGLCRRDAYDSFVVAWQAGNSWRHRPKATEIDEIMHRDRTRRDRSKVTFRQDARQLPNGTMIVHPDDPASACLLFEDFAAPWRPDGYGRHANRPTVAVEVLTPHSTVMAMRAGFQPLYHPSLCLEGAP